VVLLYLIFEFPLFSILGLEVGRGVHEEVALVAAVKFEVSVSKDIRKTTFAPEMLSLHPNSSIF